MDVGRCPHAVAAPSGVCPRGRPSLSPTAPFVFDDPACLRRAHLSPAARLVRAPGHDPLRAGRPDPGAFIPSGSAYVTLIRSIAYAADVHPVPCGRPFVTHSGACFAEMVSFGSKRTPPCPFGAVPSRHHVKNGCGVRILRREGMGVCPDGGAGSSVGTGSPTRQHRRAPKPPLSSCCHPRGPQARSPGTPGGSGGSEGPSGSGSPHAPESPGVRGRMTPDPGAPPLGPPPSARGVSRGPRGAGG